MMGLLDRFTFPRRDETFQLPTPVSSSTSNPVNESPPTNVPSKLDPPRQSKAKATIQRQNTLTGPKRANIAATSSSRKPALVRTPSVQTRYMEMLLQIDEIPRLHNILAAFFTWILLAGYLVFPATFASLQDSISGKGGGEETTVVAQKALHTIKNVGLLYVAGACCIIGAIGMMCLWYRWRENYVWLINRIFLPGFLNSIAGIISTVINVTTSQNSQWSVTAKVTVTVTGACSGVTLMLFALYNFWVLKRVKSKHAREVEMADREEHPDTIAEKIKHAAHAKPLEPGSVV